MKKKRKEKREANGGGMKEILANALNGPSP
jgi:hypothetical protein